MPAINGLNRRRLTPKIAGSVIPSEADSEEGMATCFSLLSCVRRPTARHAPNCAKFAAEAIGIQVFRPALVNMPASMMLYIWCRPMTTVHGYRAPIAAAPNGFLTRICAPARTQFSSVEKIGPMMQKVNRAVTRTVTSGTTKRSIISGMCLCSQFSILHMSHTAMMTGMTCP